MSWISVSKRRPALGREVWICYMVDGLATKQEQTYGKIVGKDEHNEVIWQDIVTGRFLDNNRFVVTHWMPKPDNPIVANKY